MRHRQTLVAALLVFGLVGLDARGGSAALRLAASGGDVEKARRALTAGAEVNAVDGYGATPLMWAAMKGHGGVVELLLESGADVNLKAEGLRNWSALLYAARQGDERIVRLLLAAGADVNAADIAGTTALHVAAREGQAAIVDLLLGAEAEVDARETKNGESALLLAANRGHYDVVRALLASADPAIADDKGVTPLIAAAKAGHMDIVGVLVERKVDLNVRAAGGTIPGATALIHAAANGHHPVVRFLIERGADVSLGDAKGVTAYRHALNNRHEAAAKLVKAAGGVRRPSDLPVVGTGADLSATGIDDTPVVETPSLLQDEHALIGKSRAEADRMFGESKGELQQGDTLTILYRKATVEVRKGRVVSVTEK